MYFLSAINHYLLPIASRLTRKKSEIRISKSEANRSQINPKLGKFKTLIPVSPALKFVFILHCLGIVSNFGFRVSNLLLGTPLLFGCVLYGFNDLHVAGAHAKIAG